MSLSNGLHIFQESLAMSHAASDLPIWEKLYKQAFPEMKAMIDERQDGEHQRRGVDRRLILPGIRQVLIDEKVRGRNKKTGKVYDDIALEFMSDRRAKTPGWVCKDVLSEYVAYVIAPLGKGWLLPVLPMQAAWRKMGEEWKKQYGIREAHNYGWTTLFCPVPESALFPAIGGWHRVSFDPIEIEGDLD